jgi:uncharacterized protein YkwD
VGISSVVPPRLKPLSSAHLLAMVCACAMTGCANKPESTVVAVSAPVHPDTSLSGQVFEAVNAYRRSQGAKELQRHPGLDLLAQQHCQYLRQHRGTFLLSGKNVSHFGFESRVLFARERYQMTAMSENVAASSQAGTHPAPVLVRLWAGSKDHRKNMLGDWTDTGIGVVVDSDGTVFATELFATVSYSQIPPHDRSNRF